MDQGRCIKWDGEPASNSSISSNDLRRRQPNTNLTPRAYRCRNSSTDSDPLDACRLRKMESYPSSQAFPAPASLDSFSSVDTHSDFGDEDANDEQASDDECYETPPPATASDPLPATARDFAELFPSSKRLSICHDDTTLDGNMNLRVDAPITTTRGLRRDITLFHLRMYDLKNRDFSLRRYCRESGREVCHCVRKSHKPRLGARPNIQRSLSSAFAAMLPKSEAKHSKQRQHDHQQATLKRHDSGYDTMHSDQEADEERPHSSHSNKAPVKDATDVISLEFSNYAHLDLKRRGFKTDKRYDFDYWGNSYSWHRSTQKLGTTREVSYHLARRDGSLVARIVPEALSEDEADAEADKGGWIPPCHMHIMDRAINDGRLADVADIVMATGLLVLVDDSIRRHFHRQEAARGRFHFPTMKGRAAASAKKETFDHRRILAESL